MIWVYTDLYQCTIFFPFYGDLKELSRISVLCLSFETIFSTFSYPQPFWWCLFILTFSPTEVWKSQRDVLMLLSLVLHYHSKRLPYFFLKGSRCLNNILDQIESKKKKLVLLHSNTHQIWRFSPLTISSKESFCLLPTWLWALMSNSIYLHALNTSIVVNKVSTFSEEWVWGWEQAWCESSRSNTDLI